MHDAGRAQIRAAQADGRWERDYGGPSSAEVPDDLAAALAAEPLAQAWLGAPSSTNRSTILCRILQARKPETRARRIADFVEALARGEKPYPQRRRPD